ncbi:MAG: hypothetical protein JNK23_07520 [Opitutaceae bacterium]|nr:hypothetical protein [Opitutaceae bacterium]
MNCWICGNAADSREHKIKKTILTDIYGAGPYLGSRKLSHGKNGRITDLQGPNSRHIKYSAVICAACNNQRTQKHDQAFEHFARYCLKNDERLLREKVIDLGDVFGVRAASSSTDMYRYFAKHLGCDLAESGFVVPADLVRLVTASNSTSKLRLSFALDQFPLGIPFGLGKTAGIGPLITTQRNLVTKTEHHYIWSYHFGIMRICYWYACVPDPTLGKPWSSETTLLALGSVTPHNLPQDATHLTIA